MNNKLAICLALLSGIAFTQNLQAASFRAMLQNENGKSICKTVL